VAEFALPGCRLAPAGARIQRERYARLAASVTSAGRAPLVLTVSFGADLDERLLEETLAIERECCPFLALEHDRAARRLVVRVADPALDVALDALAEALAPPATLRA